ncbi:unnamed protein product [Cuscuta campestris]|uniref:Uncharacterized protein n=1 Tax=Cuscuta campestris TaxID=132261 RepID=A0A484M1V3_9ASTE|nr:unnamed protein product [Cuscuta campestris]
MVSASPKESIEDSPDLSTIRFNKSSSHPWPWLCIVSTILPISLQLNSLPTKKGKENQHTHSFPSMVFFSFCARQQPFMHDLNL